VNLDHSVIQYDRGVLRWSERGCAVVERALAGRDEGDVTVAPVQERVGPFAVSADEPFDEGADFAPRASCGDDRTAVRKAG
jgi:hypothetical protein